MRQFENRFRAQNTRVVVVTFDADWMARSYVEQTKLSWPLLLDSQRQLYRAYGMERAGWWAIYGPASIWHYLKLLAAGKRLRKPGKDWRQVGGDVIIDAAGIVRYHYVSSSPHDRPTPEQMLAVIEQAAGENPA